MSHQAMERYMVKSPYVLEPQQSLREAQDLMRECDIRHIPIVADGQLVGLVSDRDLRAAIALPRSEKLRVGDVMKQDVYVVHKSTFLREVIEDMTDLKIGSAVIVNAEQEVLGIFTTIDALKVLSGLLDDESDDEVLIEDSFETWGWDDFDGDRTRTV